MQYLLHWKTLQEFEWCNWETTNGHVHSAAICIYVVLQVMLTPGTYWHCITDLNCTKDFIINSLCKQSEVSIGILNVLVKHCWRFSSTIVWHLQKPYPWLYGSPLWEPCTNNEQGTLMELCMLSNTSNLIGFWQLLWNVCRSDETFFVLHTHKNSLAHETTFIHALFLLLY